MSTIDKTSKSVPVNSPGRSKIGAYVELVKLRITVMVLVTFVIAAVLSTTGPISIPLLLCAIAGMAAIAASGNAMNMYIERYSDYLMPRTRRRPLPDQRLKAGEVAMFGAISFGVGVGILFTAVNWQTAVVGIANWILYVVIYTPMKRRTMLNTEVGAVAGAMPVVMGALAISQSVNLVGWSLFSVLLFWQFPHFMAIAWKYREDYAAGGLKMLTVTDPTGRAAGRKAIYMAVLTLAASLAPLAVMQTQIHAWIFGVIATLLGLWYLKSSISFSRTLDNVSARSLLKVSVTYLPLYMLLLMLCCLL
ncbi:MAG: heme o synthase [Planctomycetota bacterium]